MYKRFPKIKHLAIAITLLLLLAAGKVGANSLNQGYTAKTDLPRGATVSLTQSSSQSVEKTTSNNDSLSVGVVVSEEDSLLDVLPGGSQVRVAFSGDVDILVSNLNGDVETGDKLIATPLAGILARDYPPAPGVKYIAIASGQFNEKTAGAKKISVSLEDGTKKDIIIGLIPAKMLLGNRTQSGQDNNVLTKIAKQISGKEVSFLQVAASLLVFVTAVALSGMVLQGSIKGTFISLGRNPLSRDSILTGLMRVVTLAVLILAVGVVMSYFILIW